MESGFSEEDLKLKAPDLSCFIQLKLAPTPTVIVPFELTVVALNGVSPSNVKRSDSLISFVDISTRWKRGGISTKGSGGLIVSPTKTTKEESKFCKTGCI